MKYLAKLSATLAILTGALLGLAAPASADTFTDCLSNHNLTYDSSTGMGRLEEMIQVDLRNGVAVGVIENNLVYYHGISRYIAEIDVQCAGAAYLIGGNN